VRGPVGEKYICLVASGVMAALRELALATVGSLGGEACETARPIWLIPGDGESSAIRSAAAVATREPSARKPATHLPSAVRSLLRGVPSRYIHAATSGPARIGGVNFDSPAVELLVIRGIDSVLGLVLRAVGDEPEPTRAARFAVAHHDTVEHGSVVTKRLAEHVVVGVPRQVACA